MTTKPDIQQYNYKRNDSVVISKHRWVKIVKRAKNCLCCDVNGLRIN